MRRRPSSRTLSFPVRLLFLFVSDLPCLHSLLQKSVWGCVDNFLFKLSYIYCRSTALVIRVRPRRASFLLYEACYELFADIGD